MLACGLVDGVERWFATGSLVDFDEAGRNVLESQTVFMAACQWRSCASDQVRPAANRPESGMQLAVRGRSMVRDHRRHGSVLAGGALEYLDHSPASRAPVRISS